VRGRPAPITRRGWGFVGGFRVSVRKRGILWYWFVVVCLCVSGLLLY